MNDYIFGEFLEVVSSPGGHYDGKIGLFVGMDENDIMMIFDQKKYIGMTSGIKYFLPSEVRRPKVSNGQR